MRRLAWAFVLVAFLGLSWAPPAAAGARARHRWEGAALALGAIGVLAALNEVVQAQTYEVLPPSRRGTPYYPGTAPPPGWRPEPGRDWVPGYWEESTVWVPGGWEQVWVWDAEDRAQRRYRSRYGDRRDAPERYRGQRDYDGYAAGRFVERQTGGHFERRRVWREGYYR